MDLESVKDLIQFEMIVQTGLNFPIEVKLSFEHVIHPSVGTVLVTASL